MNIALLPLREEFTEQEELQLQAMGAKTPRQFCCYLAWSIYFYNFIFDLGPDDYERMLRGKCNPRFYLANKRGEKH